MRRSRGLAVCVAAALCCNTASAADAYVVIWFSVRGSNYVYYRDISRADTRSRMPDEYAKSQITFAGYNVLNRQGVRVRKDDIRILGYRYAMSSGEAVAWHSDLERKGYQAWVASTLPRTEGPRPMPPGPEPPPPPPLPGPQEDAIRLMHTPLNRLTVQDLDVVLRFNLPRGMTPADAVRVFTRQPLRPDCLLPYKRWIESVAAGQNLSPEVLAAVLLSEMRGMDNYETWRDQAASLFRDDVSVGLCQRQVNSLIQLGIHWDLRMGRFTDMQVRSRLRAMLLDDQQNILLGAMFVRKLMNQASQLSRQPAVFGGCLTRFTSSAQQLAANRPQWAGEAARLLGEANQLLTQPLEQLYQRGSLVIRAQQLAYGAQQLASQVATSPGVHPELVRGATNLAKEAQRYKGLVGAPMHLYTAKNLGGRPPDFARFGLRADEWTPAHVQFLGWKYNTGHLEAMDEIEGKAGWGYMFLYSLRDIRASRLFGVRGN